MLSNNVLCGIIDLRLQQYLLEKMEEDLEELQLKLTEYRVEHQALDLLIEQAMSGDVPVNLLHMQQLKKKKLWLKDIIKKLESDLIDDIIA